jgi:hypothetical protein
MVRHRQRCQRSDDVSRRPDSSACSICPKSWSAASPSTSTLCKRLSVILWICSAVGNFGGCWMDFWSSTACTTPKLAPRTSSVRPMKPKAFVTICSLVSFLANVLASTWDCTPAMNAPCVKCWSALQENCYG